MLVGMTRNLLCTTSTHINFAYTGLRMSNLIMKQMDPPIKKGQYRHDLPYYHSKTQRVQSCQTGRKTHHNIYIHHPGQIVVNKHVDCGEVNFQ